jgi:hypothetical protein
MYIQGDLRGKVNIFKVDSIGHCEKKVHMNMCLSRKGYQVRAVGRFRPNSDRFLFVGLDEERGLKKEDGYSTRIYS